MRALISFIVEFFKGIFIFISKISPIHSRQIDIFRSDRIISPPWRITAMHAFRARFPFSRPPHSQNRPENRIATSILFHFPPFPNSIKAGEDHIFPRGQKPMDTEVLTSEGGSRCLSPRGIF